MSILPSSFLIRSNETFTSAALVTSHRIETALRHPTQARADARGHRLGGHLPRLRRSAQYHRPGFERGRRLGHALDEFEGTSNAADALDWTRSVSPGAR